VRLLLAIVVLLAACRSPETVTRQDAVTADAIPEPEPDCALRDPPDEESPERDAPNHEPEPDCALCDPPDEKSPERDAPNHVPDSLSDPDLASPPPTAWASWQSALAAGSPAGIDAFLATWDGPVCDDARCLVVTRWDGATDVRLRGEFNAWADTLPMTAVPFSPGVFWAGVDPPPPGRDDWQYKLFSAGEWRPDAQNRWILFADVAVNSAMHRPGAGRIAAVRGVASPQLGNARDLYVAVPGEAFANPSRRFPVFYLQDGFNVFDNPAAPLGCWRVEHAARTLAAAGEAEPVILVGVTTADRLNEYLYTDLYIKLDAEPVQVTPKLEAYAAFLAGTVKPLIDASFPTRDGAADTAVGGSSLGGLSALWIAWNHPETFGKVACLSGSLWVGEEGTGTDGHPSMREVLGNAPPSPDRAALRIYLDSGDSGAGGEGRADVPYASDGRVYSDRVRNRLISLGWPNRPEWDDDGDLGTPPADLPADTDVAGVPTLFWAAEVPPGYAGWDDFLGTGRRLLHLVGAGHEHNEAAWEARFPAVLRFLFPAP